MSKFIKFDKQIIPMPKGSEYELENGKVYDLLIRTSWGETVTKFTINGELNTPKKYILPKKMNYSSNVFYITLITILQIRLEYC